MIEGMVKFIKDFENDRIWQKHVRINEMLASEI